MKHKYHHFLWLSIMLFSLMACANAQNSRQNSQPNIILIMSDDMGYSDLGCYGGEISTPNLDKLANNGLRFSRFYNSARCCPTRASLLTGLHPHQTGIGHMTDPPGKPGQHNYGMPAYEGALNTKCVTIAEVLKTAGYSTLMTGKWHLGNEYGQRPLQRGFDKYYGCVPGATNFFKPEHPRGITLMDEPIEITDEDYYTTDAFTQYAIRFIDEAKNETPQKPFFLYLAYTAPHWPIQAPRSDVDKYRGKYMQGWSALREQRYKRMIELGLIDESWPQTPLGVREWDSLSDAKKVEMDLRMAIYAAMVDRMDQNIGKLISYLELNKNLDNTIIIFLNDNGACAEFAELGSGPAKQLETKEGHVLSYGRAWANASNTPYREYKHWVHEGGIATPFIVHWPRVIPQKMRGSIAEQYSYLPDVMASFIEIANAKYPAEYSNNEIQPLVGKSFIKLLQGENEAVHNEAIFFEHEGNKAVMQGKYKLVSKWTSESEYNWELYDMDADRTEMNNRAEDMPSKVAELSALWMDWAQKNGVAEWTQIIEIQQVNNK